MRTVQIDDSSPKGKAYVLTDRHREILNERRESELVANHNLIHGFRLKQC